MKLRTARLHAMLSQVDVANGAGLDQSELSLIERGKRVGRPETREAIAEVIGRPVDELFGSVETILRSAARKEHRRHAALRRILEKLEVEIADVLHELDTAAETFEKREELQCRLIATDQRLRTVQSALHR